MADKTTIPAFMSWHAGVAKIGEIALSQEGLKWRMTKMHHSDFHTYEGFMEAQETEVRQMLNEGWVILPCNIIFKDPGVARLNTEVKYGR